MVLQRSINLPRFARAVARRCTPRRWADKRHVRCEGGGSRPALSSRSLVRGPSDRQEWAHMSINAAIFRVSELEMECLRTCSAEDIDAFTENWFWSDYPRAFELEKAFAAVHFLLTGKELDDTTAADRPLSFISDADDGFGERLGYDLGYGPCRLFSPATVIEIERALRDLPDQIIEQRLADPALARIHAGGSDPETSHELSESARALRGFVRDTVAAREGLLVAIF
jgi:hypothetical protein